MTAERFRAILDQLGWSKAEVARLLSRDSREIRRWYSGRNAIDEEAAAWLEIQAANPPPAPMRRGPDVQRFSR